MKIRVTLLGLIWTAITLTDLHGQSSDHIQESRYKSFRVLIISPDTARIHTELTVYVDSIEQEFKDSYYKTLREFELKRNSGDDDEKEQTESVIRQAKWHEPDVVRFRYYQMISMATFVSLQEDFQKYPWEDKGSLDCQMVNKNDLETEDLVQLTRDYDFDYVIYFRDIVAEKYADSFIMDMTTYVFSKADSKVIMKKKASREGEKLFCELFNQNVLECMMTRVVNDATSDIFEVLSERQKK
jgi:hypothetical protein